MKLGSKISLVVLCGCDRYQQLKKLSGAIKPFSVAWVLPKGWGGFVYAKVVSQTITNFCASKDERITSQHVPLKYKNQRGLVEVPDSEKKAVSIATHTHSHT